MKTKTEKICTWYDFTFTFATECHYFIPYIRHLYPSFLHFSGEKT